MRCSEFFRVGRFRKSCVFARSYLCQLSGIATCWLMSNRVLCAFNYTFTIVLSPGGLHGFRIGNDGNICCLEADTVVVPFQVAPYLSYCKCSGGTLKQPRKTYGEMKWCSHMSMQVPKRGPTASTHTHLRMRCVDGYGVVFRKSLCFVATSVCAPVRMLPKNTPVLQRGPMIFCEVGPRGCYHIK